MLFICYPKCTTCQKAQRFLDAHGASYTLRDIKTDRPTRGELETWHAQSGLPLRRFFNTSGLQYRALGLKDCLADMTQEDMLDLLRHGGDRVSEANLAQPLAWLAAQEKQRQA